MGKNKKITFEMKPDIYDKLTALRRYENRSIQYILEKGVEKLHKALERKLQKKGDNQ